MPTEAIRRLLSEQEQQRLQQERERKEAQFRAEREKAAAQAVEAQQIAGERAKMRAENLEIFRKSGILVGLERIKDGLIHEREKNVQLVLNYDGSSLLLVWGSDYTLSNDGFLDIEGVKKTKWWGKKYVDYSYDCMKISINTNYQSKQIVDGYSGRPGNFAISEWGMTDRVNDWLAKVYINRQVERKHYWVPDFNGPKSWPEDGYY